MLYYKWLVNSLLYFITNSNSNNVQYIILYSSFHIQKFHLIYLCSTIHFIFIFHVFVRVNDLISCKLTSCQIYYVDNVIIWTTSYIHHGSLQLMHVCFLKSSLILSSHSFLPTKMIEYNKLLEILAKYQCLYY